MKSRYWQDWVILAAAAWLYAAPFVFGFAHLSHPAAALAWVCAVALMISSFEALTFPDPIEEWMDALAGLALLAGPWVLGFSAELPATANSVAVGAVVLACAFSALIRRRKEKPAT